MAATKRTDRARPRKARYVIRLRQLRKRFGETVAVDGIDLDIARGECFGLLGPNGAGKSTTINMTVGLLAPDSGSVEIGEPDDSVSANRSPLSADVRRRIGVAPQALAIYEELSARANLRFFGKLYGLRGHELDARVAHCLTFAQLDERADERVSGYSGGMKRRLNMAVALLHDPPILLFDEPTVGVDPQSRNAIFDSITALRDDGRTIVYTTHYMEEAERLCDRVGIVDGGRLLDVDTVPKLIARHAGESNIVVDKASGEERIASQSPIDDLRPLLEDPDVRGVHIEQPNLESVFLHLTGRSLRD